LLKKAHTMLMRDFSLPDCSFAPDTEQVKILITEILLADIGRDFLLNVESRSTTRCTTAFR